MKSPLVTVVCISYNHGTYVQEALRSIFNQTYSNIQIIVADDASSDDSQGQISSFFSLNEHLSPVVIFNEKNTGNCKIFNKALKQARGKYIMDLAADDYLYPQCIERLVERFEQLPSEYGVVFSNVDLVSETGMQLSKQYPVDEQGHSLQKIPEGNLYEEIIKRYFISCVGMMMKREVLEELGGYDEELAYEDFDFWIRSSRVYEYGYVDECLVAKRKLPQSLSTQFSRKGYDRMFESTARVCQKIAWLNRCESENQALFTRIHYEFRQALRYRSLRACFVYIELLKSFKKHRILVHLYHKIYLVRRFL